MHLRFWLPLIAGLFLEPLALAQHVRIKDIATIKGHRSNHIMGMGLVVGLNGTGDSPASLTTNKVLANFISRQGIDTEEIGVITQSAAVVIVTGELPVFARNGSLIDIKASVIGDATSLAGGTLLPTRLKAGDGNVYAVGNGPILIGQANGVGPKTLTAAVLANGGVVEKEFIPNIGLNNKITMMLNRSDYTTSNRIASAINRSLKGFFAKSLDPMTVEVKIPEFYQDQLVKFVSKLESLTVKKDSEAIVVINERTGTVVMGAQVTILPVVVSHGTLTIKVGDGDAQKDNAVLNLQGATIGDLVKSLNTLGIKPEDLVGVIQGIHAAGALNAKLELI